MKKNYAAPTVAGSGDAVQETKSGPATVGISNGPGAAPGSVGFNL
jgi:hypothetical protein